MLDNKAGCLVRGPRDRKKSFPYRKWVHMPAPNPSRALSSRLLLCLATAVMLSATALLCAWFNYRALVFRQSGQWDTSMSLKRLAQVVESYRQAMGKLPSSLADPDVAKSSGIPLDGAGQPLDAWGRPFHYGITADGYELYSYGRDGKPGGQGPDADQYAGETIRWPDSPTFWEFLILPETRGILLACILVGVLGFPLCLLQIRERAGRRPSLLQVLAANAVLAVFAIVAAALIAALHIMPGGH